MSEMYAKPQYGESFFGRVAVRRIRLEKSANVFIYSDSGFAEEAVPIVAEVGVDNVLLVEISRNGCTFNNDSRGFISGDLRTRFNGKLRCLEIPNNYDKMLLRELVKGIVGPWLGIEDG